MPQPCMFCGDVYDMEHLDCRRLRFAEAMALHPNEVEVEYRPGEWVPLERPNHPSGEFLLSFLRKANLRRRRPKRSRVQEMAGTVEHGQLSEEGRTVFSEFGKRVVAEVCTFMFLKHGVSRDVIEREFLEPR